MTAPPRRCTPCKFCEFETRADVACLWRLGLLVAEQAPASIRAVVHASKIEGLHVLVVQPWRLGARVSPEAHPWLIRAGAAMPVILLTAPAHQAGSMHKVFAKDRATADQVADLFQGMP